MYPFFLLIKTTYKRKVTKVKITKIKVTKLKYTKDKVQPRYEFISSVSVNT